MSPSCTSSAPPSAGVALAPAWALSSATSGFRVSLEPSLASVTRFESVTAGVVLSGSADHDYRPSWGIARPYRRFFVWLGRLAAGRFVPGRLVRWPDRCGRGTVGGTTSLPLALTVGSFTAESVGSVASSGSAGTAFAG